MAETALQSNGKRRSSMSSMGTTGHPYGKI